MPHFWTFLIPLLVFPLFVYTQQQQPPTAAQQPVQPPAQQPAQQPSQQPSTPAPRTPAQTPAAQQPAQVTASPTSSRAPSPSQTTDPCPSGVCNVSGRGVCVDMGKSRTCPTFKNFYLPTNLRPYFADRFPLKNADLVPQFGNIVNVTMFDNTFTNREEFLINYDWMNKYMVQYMVQVAGCSVPTQQWYQTWFCTDILKFFSDRRDPCSVSTTPPRVCASTLDDRLNSVIRDTTNVTTCPYSVTVASTKQVSESYVSQLRTHPWRDTSIQCISGINNEEEATGERKCGMFAYQACLRKDLCPTVSALGDPNYCERELSQPAQVVKINDPLDKEPSKAGLFAFIGLGVFALFALAAGLGTLNNIRLQGAKLEASKEIDRQRDAQEQEMLKKQPTGSASSIKAKGLPTHTKGLSNLMYSSPPRPITPQITEQITVSHKVTLPYQAQQPDEVHLQLGDTVDIIQQFDDGWCKGRVRSTGAVGYCPMACFKVVQIPNGGYQNRFQSLSRH